MSASGPGPPRRSENPSRPMSNLVSSPGEGSSEPSSAQPTAAQPSPPPPGSRPPLPLDGILPPGSLDGPTKSGAGQGTIGASSTPDAIPHPIRERNHELIDFLVRRAIDKCMPVDPHPALSALGARQRSAARKPRSGKADKREC